jgi:hypothetical protein
MIPDYLISLSSGAAGFVIGGLCALFGSAILRPSTYDDAWRDGYDAGRQDEKEDRLTNIPAITRLCQGSGGQARRHHTDGLPGTQSPSSASLPEMDVAAESALAGWAEELKATGELRIPLADLEATYPVPLAPIGDLLRWMKTSFPGHRLTLLEKDIILSPI